MLNYSENKPSKEYIKHIEYYKKMHREGYPLMNGKFRKVKMHMTEKAQ